MLKSKNVAQERAFDLDFFKTESEKHEKIIGVGDQDTSH
jgi:hypothetical protein